MLIHTAVGNTWLLRHEGSPRFLALTCSIVSSLGSLKLCPAHQPSQPSMFRKGVASVMSVMAYTQNPAASQQAGSSRSCSLPSRVSCSSAGPLLLSLAGPLSAQLLSLVSLASLGDVPHGLREAPCGAWHHPGRHCPVTCGHRAGSAVGAESRPPHGCGRKQGGKPHG